MHTYSQFDDMQLVSMTVSGDTHAYREIVSRYEKMVARIVKSMLGDIQQADDVGQDTFIRLYSSLKDFRGDSKLSTYIQKIAMNQSLNEIRRKKRFISLFYKEDEKGGSQEFEIQSYDEESGRDVKEVVQKALDNLEPEFRAVVVLRSIQGYSTKETAEILDLPIGTVLSRLSRAKEQLKGILEKYL